VSSSENVIAILPDSWLEGEEALAWEACLVCTMKAGCVRDTSVSAGYSATFCSPWAWLLK